jgi:hypothetical protein
MKKLFLIVTPFFFSSILKAQSLEGESFKLSTTDGISSFVFEDQNSDGRFVGGQLVKKFGRVSFTKSELDDFFVNLKKISKKSEATITTEKYTLDKYDWDSTKSTYITVGEKIGEMSKTEVKKLLKLK